MTEVTRANDTHRTNPPNERASFANRSKFALMPSAQDVAQFAILLNDNGLPPVDNLVLSKGVTQSSTSDVKPFAEQMAQHIQQVLPHQRTAFQHQLQAFAQGKANQNGCAATLVLPTLGQVQVNANGSLITLRAERKQTVEKLTNARADIAQALSTLRNQSIHVDVLP